MRLEPVDLAPILVELHRANHHLRRGGRGGSEGLGDGNNGAYSRLTHMTLDVPLRHPCPTQVWGLKRTPLTWISPSHKCGVSNKPL